MQVSAGNGLKGLRVSDGEEIGLAHVRSNRNVFGEIEVNRQRHELVKVQKVGIGDHRDVEDECKLVLGWVVEVRDLDLEQVRGESDEGHQVLFLGDGCHVFNDAIQDIMRKGSWSKSVMLRRFDHVFVVPNDGLELLLDGVGHLGSEPDVGFQKISEKFVCLFEFFFDVVEVFLM